MSADLERIKRESSDWVAARERGLTADEQDRFLEWITADPRHGEWLARHYDLAQRLKRLALWRPEHATRPNPDLLAIPQRSKTGSFRLLLGFGALAAAATLVFFLRPSPPAATIASETPFVRRILEDGSTIDLRPGAQVDVGYTPSARSVRLLNGEATFRVTRNPSRPFVVSAGPISFRALGTSFNVRLSPDTVEMIVTEGRVQVDSPVGSDVATPPEASVLTAGERTIMPLAESVPPTIEKAPPAEVARLQAIQPKQLEFTDTPLGQVVAEFNAANRLKIVIDDPQLASLPLDASLRSDNVEGFVRVLQTNFDLRVDRRDGMIVLRRGP